MYDLQLIFLDNYNEALSAKMYMRKTVNNVEFWLAMN